MYLRGQWLLARESQTSSVLADAGLTVTAALGNPSGMPDPRLSEKPGNDPGTGVNGTTKEAFPASKNYDLKQRLGWVGLG